MRALIYIMTPVLVLTFFLASRFVTWEKLKGVDRKALKHQIDGTQLLRGGKNQKAITALTKAIEIEPKYAEAYVKRGLAYYYLARYKEAIDDYTQTLSLNRFLADAYARRGDAYRALNDVSRAIADYTAALENRPTAITYHNRGRAYYQKFLISDTADETLKLALDDFEKAIEMQPRFAIAYLSRGDIYGHLKQQESQESDYSHALDLLTDAIENWQNQSHELILIYLWRAMAYKKNNHTDKAVNDMEKVYELFAQFYLKKIKISDIL